MNQPENPLTLARREGTIESLLENQNIRGRFNQMLGSRAPQFISSVITVYKGFSQPVDPSSVIAAAAIAATLDLPIEKSLGFAHIVPYSNRAQFQIGYRGLIQLAVRSGQYRYLNTCEVFKGEFISYDKLTGELVLDTDKRKGDTIVGYAAFFELVNGFRHAEYWTTEEITAHAQRFSQAYKAKKTDSPWFTAFDAMAKKTVLKDLLSHWGILSVQLQRAMMSDQTVMKDIDAEPEFIDNPNILPPKSPVLASQPEQQGAVDDDDEAAEAAAGLAPAPASVASKPASRVRKQETPALSTSGTWGPTTVAEALKVQESAVPPAPELRPIDISHLDQSNKAFTGRVLMEMTKAMVDADLGEEAIMQFCVDEGLAKENQTELNQLATKKLLEICSRWPEVVKTIKGE